MLDMALEWIERLKPRRAILTNLHIDLDFDRRSRAELPAGVEPAYDGMRFEHQLRPMNSGDLPTRLSSASLASRNGSSMRAVDRGDRRRANWPPRPRLAVSNNERAAAALDFAAARGVPALVIPTRPIRTPPTSGSARPWTARGRRTDRACPVICAAWVRRRSAAIATG